MEQMNIYEVIKQQQKFAYKNRERYKNGGNSSIDWLKLSERSDQIAAWLEELIQYREKDKANQGRINTIEKWITDAKENKEIVECKFSITVPKIYDGKERDFVIDPKIREIYKILKQNNVDTDVVDTVVGSWNLDRLWIETDSIECAEFYSGVYPVNWNLEDVVRLEEMCNEGEIIIRVMVKKNGKWVDNH